MNDVGEQGEVQKLPPGYIVSGRYTLERCLGIGGMGSVYLARDSMLEDSHVAIKILHTGVAHDERLKKRFLREVNLMRQVNHANVVRTYDVGTDAGGLTYFTMEVVQGQPLDTMMDNLPFEVSRVVDLAIQISEGLEAIHEAQIVHRDLKPGNIIVVSDKLVKITDFGVARASSSELTQHNEIVGSVAYIAPEVWLGKSITPATDFYALGIILYELLSGEIPFEHDEPASLMWMHVKRPPKPPKSIRSSIPGWMNQFVLKLLSKSPEDRPRSAREIINYLEGQIARAESLGSSGRHRQVTGSGRYPQMGTGTREASGMHPSVHAEMTVTTQRMMKRRAARNRRTDSNFWLFLTAGLGLLCSFTGLFVMFRYLRELLLL